MTQKIINGRVCITADKGKLLTKGDGEYLLAIDLAVGKSPEGYYEITEAEYERILAEQHEVPTER